jgi:hypothetical protein
MKIFGEHIRDFLVIYSVLDALPIERREKVNALMAEYRALNYIDVRTELGPDQIARQTDKQKKSISDNMIRAFAIESEIKSLMRSDAVIESDKKEQQKKYIDSRRSQINSRVSFIESLGLMSHKKNGDLKLAFKREVDELNNELKQLEKETV